MVRSRIAMATKRIAVATKRIAFAAVVVLLSSQRLGAQAAPAAEYHKFAIYAGAGPSVFFNNLIVFKDQVQPLQYAFSLKWMWEPHSNLSLGVETGYYRLYSVHESQPVDAHITNSSVPILLVIAMKFPRSFYASWAMGQSITFNQVDALGVQGNHDAKTWSFADFEATLGYRITQKRRVSYSVELKGFYSSAYDNKTLALLFVVGYGL